MKYYGVTLQRASQAHLFILKTFFFFFFTLKSPNVLLLEGNLVFVCSLYYLQKLLGQRILVMQHLK